jgi:cbb3-type cytochrome oxidase subunit 3
MSLGILILLLISGAVSCWLFWRNKKAELAKKDAKEAMIILDKVPGMTAAHPRDFNRSRCIFKLKDGTQVRTWKNPAGVDHIFLADNTGKMIYGGFVGWIHSAGLNQVISQIRRDFT